MNQGASRYSEQRPYTALWLRGVAGGNPDADPERLTISQICEQQFALREFIAKVKQNPELNTEIESAALAAGLEPKEFQVTVESVINRSIGRMISAFDSEVADLLHVPKEAWSDVTSCETKVSKWESVLDSERKCRSALTNPSAIEAATRTAVGRLTCTNLAKAWTAETLWMRNKTVTETFKALYDATQERLRIRSASVRSVRPDTRPDARSPEGGNLSWIDRWMDEVPHRERPI